MQNAEKSVHKRTKTTIILDFFDKYEYNETTHERLWEELPCR